MLNISDVTVTPIKTLGFRTGLRNALIAQGITSVELLENLTIQELLRTPGVGRKGVDGIIETLLGKELDGITLGEIRRRFEA